MYLAGGIKKGRNSQKLVCVSGCGMEEDEGRQSKRALLEDSQRLGQR